MEAGLPDEDSEQSKEGVLLHQYAAKPELDRKKLKRPHRDLLENNDKALREVFERVSAQFGDHLAIDSGADNLTWWLHRGIKSLYPGHPDLWEYRPNKLLFIGDYKFGYKVVTPAGANLQLRSYGVMGAELHDCDKVVVAITQPRLGFQDRITMAVYDREQIEASREQLYQIWDDCKKPDATLVAGEEQCRYCKAKLNCPAYQETMRDGAQVIPFPDAKLTKAAKESTAETQLRQCSDEQLAKMLDFLAFAEFIKETAKDVARDRIRAGGMPGYRLGKEKELRKVTDVAKAVELLEVAGIPQDKIMGCCSMALGDDGGIAEAWREAKGGTWKDTKDGINALLAEVIERSTTRPSIEKVDAGKALTL